MPQTQNTIELKGIAQVLTATRLAVPAHQRSFEWEGEVLELLEDIESAFVREQNEYFLGTLVIIAASPPEHPKVLDGQQRLATTTLLLAAMADRFETIGEKDRAAGIRRDYLAKYDIVANEESPQLRLNEIDDPYFRTLLKPGYTEPARGAEASHKRLFKSRGAIGDWLDKKLASEPNKALWLTRLFQYLKDSTTVIYLNVPDDSNAFLIFETLNDRGLELSIADLLKNYLLGLAQEDLRIVLNLWVGAQGALRAYGGEGRFRVFLRHYWISRYDIVRERDLYRKMKERITSKVGAVDFAGDLAHNASLYGAMLSPEHEFWDNAPQDSRDWLRILHVLGLEQYRPMLLSAMARMPVEAVCELLRMLVGWNVRLTVVGALGTGTTESRYAEIGQAIDKATLKTVKEVRERGKEFVPSDQVFETAFATATVSKLPLARYYLRALERVRDGDPQPELVPNENPAELTLEHVLPENPGMNWPQWSEEDHRVYWRRLGNMVLLRQKVNSKLRSAAFDEKKPRLAASALLLTRNVGSASRWDRGAIDERQREMAKLALAAWRL